ncbi:copper-transporting P1-type ATPase [Scheffersomyces xylosifermentans]|uniref:copper-transporting P1-type ATPase n=1 Tax=Scheffersomyces xylosifermentans TaxID=1304137 RepID=UPI00315CCB8E
MEHLHINFANIHCDTCVSSIRNILSQHFRNISYVEAPETAQEDVKNLAEDNAVLTIDHNEVDLYYNPTNSSKVSSSKPQLESSIKKIIKSLTKAGFQLLSWEIENGGEVVHSSSHNKVGDITDQLVDHAEGFFDIFNLYSRFVDSKASKNHLKSCKSCQASKQEEQAKAKAKVNDTDSSNDLSTVETVVEKPDKEYRAVFSITGMTCASCVQTVTNEINAILNDGVTPKSEDANFSVDLIQQSAVAILPNKQLINKIVDAINDTGFECRLLEVLPVQRSINTKVTAMITGMTCVACANSIQSAVKELPFVLDSGINVVTKSGQFILEESATDKEDHLEKLKETIEDCGFDFEVLKKEKINYTSSRKKSRTINISVEGMFCDHCPEIVTNYLSSYGEAVVINDPLTLSHPYIKFTYIPGKDITVRKFLFDLNHISPSEENEDGYIIDSEKEGVFKCALVDPVSMDEHLRRLSKKELLRIVVRLVIATIFAIPTFVFGIVAMSLLPKANSFRVWVDEPMWAGNVSRNTWILFFLSTPVYFFAADIFHRKAFKEVRSLWLHKNSFKTRIFKFGSMNLLMCLGTSIAYFASIVLLILSSQQKPNGHMGLHTTYFDSVVFLTFFLLIGRLLESYSKSKTASAIANLGSLKVSKATLVENVDGDFTNDDIIDVKYLETDDFIRIATGESPPVDCVIVQGSSEFDESALTGESVPVKHAPGHQIFSGTVNTGTTSVIAKIISLEGDSLIDQIVNTVRDGQMRKAPIERTADLLTGYFVPVITLLAVLTWVIWLALGYSGALPKHYLDIDIGGWAVWSLEFSIAVFVIACPCGIGLAAPTALFVGSGLAAKYGILAKGGGVAFQDGANTNVVCFDKTGTLTLGELQVTDYAFVNDSKFATVVRTIALQLARDLELSSKHPLAKAVKSFVEEFAFKRHDVRSSQNKVPQIETIPGKGLKGEVIFDKADDIWNEYKPTEVILGNEALFKEYGVTISSEQQAALDKWKTECKSIILVGVKSEVLFGDDGFHMILMIATRDQVRPETKQVIDYLQNVHNIECWMITGDNKITAEAIGKELGIKNIVSEVLPDEKQAQVKKIQQLKNTIVAMVGDGINDAPALATADVGIALSSGADLAVTSSDFILLSKTHPLVTLVTLLDLSRAVFRRVKFNFGWSLVYNVIGIPIAAGVIYPYKNTRLSPVWASVAMAASSISVVSSSLALKLYKPKIRGDTFQLEESELVEPKEVVF